MRTRPEPLRFYAELYVERPPSVVWSFFSDLKRWGQWSPVCRESRVLGSGRLEEGAVLQLRLGIGAVPFNVSAKLVDVSPPSAVSWQGRAFGVEALHTYRFRAHRTGTLMTNEEMFYGVSFPLDRLIAGWYRTSGLSSKSLRGIKRVLELESVAV